MITDFNNGAMYELSLPEGDGDGFMMWHPGVDVGAVLARHGVRESGKRRPYVSPDGGSNYWCVALVAVAS